MQTSPEICELSDIIVRKTEAKDFNFEIAKQIADAASFFDGINQAHVGHEREQAIQHIEALHDIAEALAGDRVNEIYAPEEECNALLNATLPLGNIY